jgi:uncharacterized membrane protein (DUF106 family)
VWQQLNRLQQTLDKSQEKNEMQFKLVEQHEENKSHLEQEIMQHKLEEQNLRKVHFDPLIITSIIINATNPLMVEPC